MDAFVASKWAWVHASSSSHTCGDTIPVYHQVLVEAFLGKCSTTEEKTGGRAARAEGLASDSDFAIDARILSAGPVHHVAVIAPDLRGYGDSEKSDPGRRRS
jgi:hypothetical protein